MQGRAHIGNYFAADIISQLGSNIAFIALHWYIIEQTDSNVQVGIASMVGVIAGLITCPMAGILADIFSRKSILIYSNYIRALSVSIALFLLYNNSFHPHYVYLLFIIAGIGFNIYIPASKAFLQEIITDKEAVKYSGYLELNVQISLLVAGALSGILYKLFGIYIILALDILTFIIAGLLLYPIECSKQKNKKKYLSIWNELKGGIDYFSKEKIIFYFMLIMILPHIATIAQNIVLPGYVMHHLQSDAVTYGMMSTMYGVGATIISAIFIFYSSSYFTRQLLYKSFMLSIAAIFALIMTKSVTISLIGIFFFGFANSSIKIALISTMMRAVDRSYMGRVISVKNFAITLMQMFSAYNIGYFMDKNGDITGFICLEAIMVAAFILYLSFAKKFDKLLAK